MQLGFELMLMGMGTVFAFLVMLIFCMMLMSKMIALIENNKPETEQLKIPDNILIEVISAAIHQHRHRDKI